MSDRHGPEFLAGVTTPARRSLASPTRVWQLGLAALALSIVAACGGGGDGVGSNGTGVSSGTVYGFGSVIVDGLEYDDSRARVQVAQGDAGDLPVLTETRLGQRVEVTVLDDGSVSVIEVMPVLIGRVETTNVVDGTFVVVGQKVQLVSSVNSGKQAVSVVDGAVNPGDYVEVHGVRTGSGPNVVYRATRVENLGVDPGFIRVAGVAEVSGDTLSTNFNLGAVSVRGPTPVRAGDQVTVFADSSGSSVTSGYDATTHVLAASAVKIRSVLTRTSSSDYLSGVIEGVNAVDKTFMIDGVTIDYSRLESTDFEGLTLAQISSSSDFYVRMKGRYVSPTRFVGSKLQLRSGDDDVTSPAELKGTVMKRVPAVGNPLVSFTVRDTEVSLASTVTYGSNCAAVISEGTFVEVKGLVRTGGLTATRIECPAPSQNAVIERVGTVESIIGNQFTLRLPDGSRRTVTFSVNTFVRGIVLNNSATGSPWIDGLTVEVEGVDGAGNATSALKIKLEN